MQKLVRNGNSTQVTIPRQLLGELEWLPGQGVIVETLEDKSLHIRLPQPEDFSPLRARRVLELETPSSKA